MLNISIAQEKFDIVSFKMPKGWQKSAEANAVQFTKQQGNGVAIMMLFKSIPTSKDSKTTFDASWDSIVKELFDKVDNPQMQPTMNENGWTIENGAAVVEKDGSKAVANLISATGGGKVVNLLIIFNSEAFQTDIDAFISSINLPKVEAQTTQSVPQTDESNTRLIGKWQRSSSVRPVYADPVSWGTGGYTTSRYEFKNDGSYVFTQRSFSMTFANIIVVKENGNYKVDGNKITIAPKKSLIESYSKNGGTDKLGKLISSQNRSLETISYRFTFHYFTGIKEWNLVLQADAVTQRDGAFSNNKSFENAWYFDQKYTDKDLTAP